LSLYIGIQEEAWESQKEGPVSIKNASKYGLFRKIILPVARILRK